MMLRSNFAHARTWSSYHRPLTQTRLPPLQMLLFLSYLSLFLLLLLMSVERREDLVKILFKTNRSNEIEEMKLRLLSTRTTVSLSAPGQTTSDWTKLKQWQRTTSVRGRRLSADAAVSGVRTPPDSNSPIAEDAAGQQQKSSFDNVLLSDWPFRYPRIWPETANVSAYVYLTYMSYTRICVCVWWKCINVSTTIYYFTPMRSSWTKCQQDFASWSSPECPAYSIKLDWID